MMRSLIVFKMSAIASIAAAAIAASVSLSAAQSVENSIEVIMNQAKIVKLTKDAATIVVGNPEIDRKSVV